MGHALQHTLMDVMTRHKRMSGYRSLWLPGMDHAGISTQLMVSRALKKEGKSRHDLGRELFVGRVWKWKKESGLKISWLATKPSTNTRSTGLRTPSVFR